MHAKILLMAASIFFSVEAFSQDATTPATTPVAKAKKKKKQIATTTPAVTATTTTPAPEVKKEKVKAIEAPKAVEPAKVEAVIDPLSQEAQKKYVKEHFSASYHGEYYFVRRNPLDDSNLAANPISREISDLKILHNPTIIYKPTPNWQVLSTAEFKFSDNPTLDPVFPNAFYRALFTVTRKNIMTEKERGFQLDAGIGRRVFNAGVASLPLGNTRAFATVSKSFGKHSASLFAQYLFNDVKQSNLKTWNHGLELIPTLTLQLTEKLSYMFNDDIIINKAKFANQAHDFDISHEMNAAYITYQWTDKLNTYYQLKYYHSEGFAKVREYEDYTENYAGVGYTFNPKLTLTFEFGSELNHSSDRRDLFSLKSRYPEYTLYVDASF